MKKHKIASYFLIFALFALTISCNKDKNSDPNNDKANNGQNGGGGSSNVGAPFTYDFTITGGKYDGHYSDKCDNKSSISSTNAYLAGDNPEVFSVSMSNEKANKISIIGSFIHYKNGSVADFDDKNKPSGLNISFTDDSTYLDIYHSVSGTANVSDIHKVANALASYKAVFDGIINNSKDGDVHIKGTIKTYLPAD